MKFITIHFIRKANGADKTPIERLINPRYITFIQPYDDKDYYHGANSIIGITTEGLIYVNETYEDLKKELANAGLY